MIKANKSRLFEKIFSIYNRNLLRRNFSAFFVSGNENLNSLQRTVPLIIYCNHSSFWDGLVAFRISEVSKLNSYVMMEEKQLKRYFLFKKLGAFSIDRENPWRASKSLKYISDLFNKNPATALWIFPQGKILPNNARPLTFFKGISKIIKSSEQCCVVPIAMRYEFGSHHKPMVFVEIGNPKIFNSDIYNSDKTFITQNLSDELTNLLNSLRNKIINDDISNFENIL